MSSDGSAYLFLCRICLSTNSGSQFRPIQIKNLHRFSFGLHFLLGVYSGLLFLFEPEEQIFFLFDL